MATLDKTAQIPYEFSDDNKMEGSLREPDFKILVQFREKNNFSHGIELSSNHKHHLPTMFIHVHENESEKPNISVHPKPETTLKSYLNSLQQKGVVSVMFYNRFINHGGGGAAAGSGGGAAAAAGYYYVPDEVRAIVKAIISALLYLHRKQGSLSGPLGWHNFVIYDAYLALRNASYRKKDKDTTKLDFKHVHDFIANKIFENFLNRIPTDMKNLLDSLLLYPRNAKPERNKLIGYHFATMSHSERIYFMINCSDKERIIDSLGGARRYPRAIKYLGSQRGWTDNILNSTFPDIVLCYKARKYHNDADDEDNMKRNAIRCCRNLATHLGEYLEEHTLSFTDMDIDIIVSSIFAPMLVEFSWKLLHQRVLKYVITWMEDA